MKLLFLITGLLFSTCLQAQKKEGLIIFERKQNIHRNVSPEMRAMVPEFRVSRQMLIFADQRSLYKTIPEDEAPDPFNNKGGMGIKLSGQNTETYLHFGENVKLIAAELFGDAYLIGDSIKKYNWTLVDETKTIGGYVCKKAVTTIKTVRQSVRMIDGGKTPDQSNLPVPKLEEAEVTGWYSVDLLSQAGPDNYSGLPGVILEVDVDKGGTVFSAVEFRPLNDVSQLKAPKKGRKLTQDEYNKQVKKVMENLGSGPVQIRSGM